MPDLEDVRRIAAGLPGTEEKSSGGGVAWFVRRKPYAWESMPWPSEPEHVRTIVAAESCIGVNVADGDEKSALLQGWPAVFLDAETKWSALRIIVRLGAVDDDHLAELVTESWRTQAPQYLQRELE